MNAVALVFPHQLFESNQALEHVKSVVIVESDLYYNQFSFIKQKLVLHRASQRDYAEKLVGKGFSVQYIDAQNALCNATKLVQYLSEKYNQIHLCEPGDNWLLREIREGAKTTAVEIILYTNPNFITPLDEAHAYFQQRKRYFQTDFYNYQRKKHGILMDDEGKPLGGKLTFDSENRKPFPKNVPIPTTTFSTIDKTLLEAIEYVEKNYPNNPGSLNYFKQTNQFFPYNSEQAHEAFNQFLEERLSLFGAYEDAFSKDPNARYLFHSVLTPYLNIGLISPQYVLDKSLEFSKKNDVSLNSIEGFTRQILGWREFMRYIYHQEGSKQQNSNFWDHQRSIPESFYNGTTGIEPIDNVIKNLLETGYAHHIERLMILGNFFLLCEFAPYSVYKWFMEMCIDSYDWVMVPNVYGMSQFADGGLITTKPYFSGSNYLLKMSDYKKGDGNWQAIWDALFWRFVNKQRQFLQQNPRMAMMVITYDKMSTDKKSFLEATANTYLLSL
jgi:deoxyribodipyrimidine photolyase-related protein